MIYRYFDIDESYMDNFFKPIKNKVDIIRVLLEGIRYISLEKKIPDNKSKGRILISVDKMSRIFFLKSDKYYSIFFPFSMSFDERIVFRFKNIFEVNSEVVSKTISIINDPSFYSSCSFEFANMISDCESDISSGYWDFLRALLLMEDGYLRYDHDPVNYIKHGKCDLHPLHHFDIFYSSNSTFKLGLHNSIDEPYFYDLLDIKTNCKYVG